MKITLRELENTYTEVLAYDAVTYSGIVLYAWNDAGCEERVFGKMDGLLFVVRLYTETEEPYFIKNGRRYKLSNFMRSNF